MTKGSDFLVSRIIASGTGIISIPTLFCTGCRSGIMMRNIMAEGVAFFIGRIVTAATGYISIPAVLCAGSGFSIMGNRVMTEGGDFCVGGIIAPGTGVVSIPTDCRTGCRSGIMMRNIMAGCLYCFYMCCGTYSAGIGFLTGCCTGRLCGHFAAIPNVRRCCIDGVAAGAFFPVVVGIILPYLAGKIMTESIAIQQVAGFAPCFLCTGSRAAGVHTCIFFPFADRAFEPMAGRVHFPNGSPTMYTHNKSGGIPATVKNYADRGIVVFILKFGRIGIFCPAGSNANVTGTIRRCFRRYTDGSSTGQFACDRNSLVLWQVDIVCIGALFVPCNVNIIAVYIEATATKIYPAAIARRGVVYKAAADNIEVAFVYINTAAISCCDVIGNFCRIRERQGPPTAGIIYPTSVSGGCLISGDTGVIV